MAVGLILAFGYNYPEGHELGLGSLPQREVFGKLTETGELDANFARLGEKWATEEIAEVERILFDEKEGE